MVTGAEGGNRVGMRKWNEKNGSIVLKGNTAGEENGTEKRRRTSEEGGMESRNADWGDFESP